MGLEDRQYYRDEGSAYGRRSFSGAGGRWSVVSIIIAINVAIFILDAFTPLARGQLHWLNTNLAMDSTQPWKVWTLLTHGFAHSSLGSDIGFWHIAGNMLTLFFLGRPVEQSLGHREFLKFYLLAILVSGGTFLVIHIVTGSPAFVVGASGAVSAVVALFIFMYPKVKLLLMGILPMPAWLLGVLILALDFSNAFQPESHIAWESHLAGAAFGVAYYMFKWDFGRLNLGGLPKVFSSRPKLKVHDPNRGFDKLKAQADQILAKINVQGEESLSSRERKILNKYSQQIRKHRD